VSPQLPCFEIRVRGRLSEALLCWLGLSGEGAGGDTILRGRLTDQVQLHGLLDRIASLGLELIDLRWEAPGPQPN
jgi:hypothetical protein